MTKRFFENLLKIITHMLQKYRPVTYMSKAYALAEHMVHGMHQNDQPMVKFRGTFTGGNRILRDAGLLQNMAHILLCVG